MLRLIYRFFTQESWAREKLGGKWERWDSRWGQVEDWSDPRTRPQEYGEGKVPERENWG